MKKTMRFLSMAALALVGAVMTGCSNDDNLVDTPQQPENKDNVVTLTTTVGFDDGATTRALTPNGEKTFAAGDKIAVIYKNTSSKTVKEVVDISSGGGTNTATFTVTFTNPNRTAPIRYIYPAAMAKEPIAEDANIDDAGTVDFTKLDNQDGTLATLGSNLDLCTFDETTGWESGLPTGTLVNKLAILAITLKNGSGPEINSAITGMTISDGTYTYNVSRSAAETPIYVAIHPTDAANISICATDGTKNYVKYLTNKTYEINNGYNVSWRMTIPMFTVGMDGSTPKKVQFAKGNVQVTYDGNSWTWGIAEHEWDYIGNAWGNTVVRNGHIAQIGTVDLFGWVGASSNFSDSEEMYGISERTSGYGDVATEALKHDWGTKIGTGWRTPTKDEWVYVFTTRESGSTVNSQTDARYTYATVNGVHGVILFPDGVTIASDVVTTWGAINDRSNWATQPTTAQWATLAAKGCVFLPAAGYRDKSSVQNVGVGGYYWSSSAYPDDAAKAYSVFLKSNNQGFAAEDGRFYGFSVRLVYDPN